MADIELIVKMPEEKYNKFMYSDDVDEEELVEAFEYLMNGTPMPDNATNSDVMLTMFPDETDLHTFARHNKVAWWNAPYQKGGKE